MADTSSYKNIFKTTFLFGFVRVFNIIVKVGLNKVAALVLGPSGIGIIGMFNTTILTVVNFASLGINQSAIRDISEARSQGDSNKCDLSISMVTKVVRVTGLLGTLIMVLGSPLLSKYTFGNYSFTLSYALLGIAVWAQIISNGQMAVLTGMRKLKQLAKCSMISAVIGMAAGIPFYIFFKDNGIVPSLIVSSLAMTLVSYLYIKKIGYKKISMNIHEMWKKSSLMIKMGIALMLQALMLQICNLVVAAYVSNNAGLDILGYYQSGLTIITGYFGIILTSLSTEYYPRLASINNHPVAMNDAVNAQSEMGLMMAFPLVLLFVYLSSFFFKFLYSSDFIAGIQYVDWAVMGTVTIIASNSIGLVLIVKQKTKEMLIVSLILNVLFLAINILFFNLWGLLGLGLGYFLSGLLQFIVNNEMTKFYFNIKFNKTVIAILLLIILFIITLNLIKSVNIDWIRNFVSIFMICIAAVVSFVYLQRKTGFKFSLLINKIKR